MSDHLRAYNYMVLRYRHDPMSGEFVNVGVILHEPKFGLFLGKVRTTTSRLSRLFPMIDTKILKDALRSVERGISKTAKDIKTDLLASEISLVAIANKILPSDDSSFIWGPVGNGVTKDATLTLSQLFERYVSRYDDKQSGRRDDAAIWRPVHDRLQQLDLAKRLAPKIIQSSVDKIEFEHAWKNGKWHVYQPLSFDLVSPDGIREKAARWAGHMLALKGASDEFEPHFFIGAPSDPDLQDAYRAAKGILGLSPVRPEIIEEADMESFVAKIEDELRSHAA